MSTHELIGIGLPVADVTGIITSLKAEDILQIPDAHNIRRLINEPSLRIHPGGVVPNILYAYHRFSQGGPTELIGCVGEDLLGALCKKNFRGGQGRLQIDQRPTGISVCFNKPDGEKFRFFDYGAATQLKIMKEWFKFAGDHRVIIVTDLYTLRLPFKHGIIDLINYHQKRGGIAALNLGGMKLTSPVEAINILKAFISPPDLIFGNKEEFQALAEVPAQPNAIETIFRPTRLAVETLGNEGSMVRFEGTPVKIDSFYVPNKQIISEIGAGDCFMGVILAELCQKPYKEWTLADVILAARKASFTASLVIQQEAPRLSW